MLPRLGADVVTLGETAIDWIETYCVHGPGDVEGTRVELDEEQQLFLMWAYAQKKAGASMRRAVHEAWFSRPKGRAKSEFAGFIVLFEALGPARYAGLDKHGEPVGRPVVYPFIRCLATEEEQSANTYDNVLFVLRESAALIAEYGDVDAGVTRTILPGGGEIRPSTASSAAKDGGKETFVVGDEPHLYVLPELKKMLRTVMRNMVKRKSADPWALLTTTMFEPGEHTPAETAYEEWLKRDREVLSRRGILYDHREAPPIKRYGDDREILRALKHVYGSFAKVMDLGRVLAEMRHPDATEAEGRRYFLNQRHTASGAWMSRDEWDLLADRGRGLIPGEPVCLGFDGSKFHDATGLVAITEDAHIVTLAVWEKPTGPAAEGWEVPSLEVNAAVADAFECYDVVRFYADPPYWTDEVAKWHGAYGDAVTEWWTNTFTKMARAVGAFGTAVRSEAVTHDGHEALGRHIANARRLKVRVKLDDDAEEAHVITKDRRGSPRKIDLAVCAILALQALNDALRAGEFAARRKPRRRKLHSF